MNNKKNMFPIILLYTFLIVICLLGIFFANFSHISLILLAVVSFSAVVSAALLISWGAECFQFIVSQGFAIAVIALLQVIPEFFIEGVIAWQRDVPLMLANFTGSNRLLMGLGWSGVYFIMAIANLIKQRKWIHEIKIKEVHSIEVIVLLASSFYFFIILIKGTITVIDSFVLFGMFYWYMKTLYKLDPEEKENEDELIMPCKAIVQIENTNLKKIIIFSLFILGGATFMFIAEPFLHSLRGLASLFGISAFVFVQWMAPFLSEFPEKVTSFYWAARIKYASMGLVNFISSKVNQWTLLIAMVPIVYSISMGGFTHIPLDSFHKWQIFLSMAMTFYGCSTLAKFSFTSIDAFFMFTLWFIQFVRPDTMEITSFAFIILTIANLIIFKKQNRLFRVFAKCMGNLKNKR